MHSIGYGASAPSSVDRRAKARRYGLFSASRANILVFAERNFQRGEQLLFVKTEALPIGNVPHVRAKFAVGPQEIADRGEQMFDFVVPLDQVGDVAGRARRANILQRLRRLRVERTLGTSCESTAINDSPNP